LLDPFDFCKDERVTKAVRHRGRAVPAAEAGPRIQECRESAGLSREALADKAGMSYLRIWRLENGKQKVLLEDLEAIAVALDRSVLDILTVEARAS
jgi:transcriptional regulator with XRE-family HTH domain